MMVSTDGGHLDVAVVCAGIIIKRSSVAGNRKSSAYRLTSAASGADVAIAEATAAKRVAALVK